MARLSATQYKHLTIATAAVLVIALSTWISLDPDNYFFYRDEDRQRWRHPTTHFLIVCVCYVAEAFFVAKALKLGTGKRLWPRTLLATLLFLPWTAFSSIFVVHAPVYLHVHILWTWLLLATLALVTVGSAARHVFDGVRGVNRAAKG